VNLSIMGRTVVRLAVAAFLFTPVLCMAQVKVSPGTIATIAGDQSLGNPAGIGQYTGDTGPATSAQLYLPFQAVFNGGNLYIADQADEAIRYVTGSTGIITTIAGDGSQGFTQDGIKATTSSLSSPCSVWVDSSGNVYIADTGNNVIRMVNTKGIISTVAGVESSAGYQGDGFGAASAELNKPSSILFDSAGNMYFADSGNNVIRKVSPSTAADPDVISTYAGLYNGGTAGYTGDNGLATKALLSDPVAIAMDSAGNLYIADCNNHVVRKVTASTGVITTIAGNGTYGFSGDGGPAVFAQLFEPKGVAVDAAGNVYISDTLNNRVRMVAASTGIINTVVGTGHSGYSGDGGLATAAQLSFPAGLSIDSSGNVYIADNGNNVIRQYAPPAAVTGASPVISSGGVIGASSFGALSAIAPGSWIEIYGSNLASSAGGWSGSSFTGVNAPTALNGTTVNIAGLSAFIDYVSPGQVNAQVPSGVGSGPQNLVVATTAGKSAAYTVTVNATEAGLFAPSAFLLSGKQYVGAQLSDGSWALPSPVPGYTTRLANVGESMTLYGVGFGPVTPSIPAGQIVQAQNALVNPLLVFFGQTQAQVTYDGLAPGLVGVYQINVVVPNIAPNIVVPITFTLGGTPGAQTLYTAVQ